jgi:hypothetical protein
MDVIQAAVGVEIVLADQDSIFGAVKCFYGVCIPGEIENIVSYKLPGAPVLVI